MHRYLYHVVAPKSPLGQEANEVCSFNSLLRSLGRRFLMFCEPHFNLFARLYKRIVGRQITRYFLKEAPNSGYPLPLGGNGQGRRGSLAFDES
jgi:hypothetical protein